MKRYIKAATIAQSDITDNILNDIFKNIPWKDVDYADRLINRTCKKYGIEERQYGFSQAHMMKDLPENVYEDLMHRLENPKDLRPSKKTDYYTKVNKGKKTTLKCVFEPYLEEGNLYEVEVTGKSLIDAFMKLLYKVKLYITPQEIEEDEMSANQILDRIKRESADGCDWIIELTNETTGETYIKEKYDYEDVED